MNCELDTTNNTYTEMSKQVTHILEQAVESNQPIYRHAFSYDLCTFLQCIYRPLQLSLCDILCSIVTVRDMELFCVMFLAALSTIYHNSRLIYRHRKISSDLNLSLYDRNSGFYNVYNICAHTSYELRLDSGVFEHNFVDISIRIP